MLQELIGKQVKIVIDERVSNKGTLVDFNDKYCKIKDRGQNTIIYNMRYIVRIEEV